jgi:N-acetylmuramoyl-L-alanine amidase
VRRSSLITAVGAAVVAVALPACASSAPAGAAVSGPSLVSSTSASPAASTSSAVASASVATSSAGAVSPTPRAPSPRGSASPTATPTPTTKARGPVPLGTDGGLPVLVAPTWQMVQGGPQVPWPAAWPRPVRFVPKAKGPLSGLVIALDPGHDIGNGAHTREVNATHWVGFTKACNTTGTATNSGYPEATYTFDVTARLRRLLTAAGATVVVTRDRNTTASWGPCIGARGAFGKQQHAAFMVQVHADGGPGSGHGFHTIVPKASSLGSTRLTAARDQVLARAMIAGMKSGGFTPATYLSSPLQIRTDQGAMTVSQVPIVTVETLNMRNAGDAAVATSSTGRQRVARALYLGILKYAAGL